MARVAIVTGGTRGIGEAISLALQAQGRTVVANYAGNDERARRFADTHGIKVFKWDVGDHQACI
ncbi:MAG: SDR family NAD(P)-dependent oxidoreductase, partial [Tsuneonella sp.]